MFCEVRRSFARVYLPLYVARGRGKSFFSAISFALRQFRALAAQKRIPARELWYFARNAPRCFSSIDVAAAATLPPPPFSISPSYDLNSLDHIFAMFRPSNFRPPPLSLLLLFLLFPSHFRRNTRPLLARRGRLPSRRSPYSSNPVNQNSTRKRGQMYTMRGARRTGCPERSPAAIDFRRLDGISAKICFPRTLGASFPDCLVA